MSVPSHSPPPDWVEGIIQEWEIESSLHVPFSGALLCEAEFGKFSVQSAPDLDLDKEESHVDNDHEEGPLFEIEEMGRKIKLSNKDEVLGACMATPIEGVTESEHRNLASRRSPASALFWDQGSSEVENTQRLERWGNMVREIRRRRRMEAWQNVRNLFSMLSVDGEV
jgi:hypothetical protein